MALFKRGEVYWVDFSHAGKRYRLSCETTSEAVAKRTAKRLKQELVEGSTVGGITFDEAFKRAWASDWRDHKSLDDKVRNARTCMEIIGYKLPVSKYTNETARLLRSTLMSRNYSASTVNAKMAEVSALLNLMRDTWMMDGIPAPNLKKLKTQGNARERTVTPAEEKRLVAMARRDGKEIFADIIELLLYTGFRKGELLKLPLRSVDFENNLLVVYEHKGKTSSGVAKSIPMTNHVRSLFEKYRYKYKEHYFEKVSEKTLCTWWGKWRTEMGLGDDAEFVIHGLRHTCASRMVAAGVPLRDVQLWLGHRSITTTERYAHMGTEHLGRALDALNAYREAA